MTDEDIAAPIPVPLDDYAELVQELAVVKRERERAEVRAGELKDMVLKLLPPLDDAPDGMVLTVGGQPVLTFSPYSARQLNQKRLRELYPAAVADCTTWATRWTLRNVGRAEDGS